MADRSKKRRRSDRLGAALEILEPVEADTVSCVEMPQHIFCRDDHSCPLLAGISARIRCVIIVWAGNVPGVSVMKDDSVMLSSSSLSVLVAHPSSTRVAVRPLRLLYPGSNSHHDFFRMPYQV